MGRPKVSQRIKTISLGFVKVITKNGVGGGSEDCISINAQFGRKSLHSAMQYCLPHLTRSGNVTDNREGISQMELNKLIRAQGHTMARKRDSIHPGRREWTDIRWVNPCAATKNADFLQVQAGIADLHHEFPETTSCTLDIVLQFIAIARRPMSESDYAQAMEERLSRVSSTDSQDEDDDDDERDDSHHHHHHRAHPTAFSRCSSARTVPRDATISRTTSALFPPDAAHRRHHADDAAAAGDPHHHANKPPFSRAWAELTAAGEAASRAAKRARKSCPPDARDGAFALADVAAANFSAAPAGPSPAHTAFDLPAPPGGTSAGGGPLPPFSAAVPPPSAWPSPLQSQCYPGPIPGGAAGAGAAAEAVSPLLPGLVSELMRSQMLLSQYSALLRNLISQQQPPSQHPSPHPSQQQPQGHHHPPPAPSPPPPSPPSPATLQPLHLTMHSLLPHVADGAAAAAGGGKGGPLPPISSISPAPPAAAAQEPPDAAAVAAAMQLQSLQQRAHRSAAASHGE